MAPASRAVEIPGTDAGLKSFIYAALIRSVLFTGQKDLGASLAERLVLASNIRKACNVSASEHEEVLSYALQHNAYTIQSFAERAVALSAATSDKQKVKLAGADAHLVPQRSEFDSLSKGCDAWRLGEIAELHSAVQASCSQFGGHLEIEVVDGEVSPPREAGGVGCFACFSGGSSEIVPRSVAVALGVKNNADREGRQQLQPQRTPWVTASAGSKITWRCHVSPFRVFAEDAQLRVQLKDSRAGREGAEEASDEHMVGQVHIPLQKLMAHGAAVAAADAAGGGASGGSVVVMTCMVPLYGHASAGTSVFGGKSSASGARKPGVHGDEEETFGRATYDPASRTAAGTQGREVKGFVRLKLRYVTERRLPVSPEQAAASAAAAVGQVPPAAAAAAAKAAAQKSDVPVRDSKGVPVLVLPSSLPELPELPIITATGAAAGRAPGTSQGGAGPDASGLSKPDLRRTSASVSKDMASLASLSNTPALQVTMGVASLVWSLWQAEALDERSERGRRVSNGDKPLRQLWKSMPAREGGAGRKGGKHRRGHSQGSNESPLNALAEGGVLSAGMTPSVTGKMPLGSKPSANGAAAPGPLAGGVSVTGPSASAFKGAKAGKGGAAQMLSWTQLVLDEDTAAAAAQLGGAGLGPLYDDLLSLFSSPLPGAADAEEAWDNETIPGAVYWSILEAYCSLFRIRPMALRLCMLSNTLAGWLPGQEARYWVVESCRRLMLPLSPLEDGRLLTRSESTLYGQATGALLQRCIDIMERNYDMFPSIDTAIASMASVLSIMQLVVGSSSGPELVVKMLRIHMGTAVERRMRTLLHADRANIAKLAGGFGSGGGGVGSAGGDGAGSATKQRRSSHTGVSPEELERLAQHEQFADVSSSLASWVAEIMGVQQESGGGAAGASKAAGARGSQPKRGAAVAAAAAAAAAAGDGARTQIAQDTTALIMATAIIMEDTQSDLLLQPVFMGLMDLPAFTTNIRYKLLVDALKRNFSSNGTPVTFSPAVHVLEGKLHELHGMLLDAGLGAYSAPVQAQMRALLGPAAVGGSQGAAGGGKAGSVANAKDKGKGHASKSQPHSQQQSPSRTRPGAGEGAGYIGSGKPASRSPSSPTLSRLSVGASASNAAQRASAKAPEQLPASVSDLYTKPVGQKKAANGKGEGGSGSGGGAEEGPVELIDVTALLGPSVELLIRSIGMRLLEWVDKTVESELSAHAASASGSHHQRNGSGGTPPAHGAASKGAWAPVSTSQQVLYSFSVVDLYWHLGNAVEAVARRVMAHGTMLQNAHAGRLLHQAVSRAVRRYISHVERQSVRQVTGYEGPAEDPAAGGAAGAAAGGSRHRRTPSNPPQIGLMSLAPPVAVGAAPKPMGLATAGSGGGSGAGAGGGSGGMSASSSKTQLAQPEAGGGWSRLVVTPELCVLLCNMEEVVAQQVRLEAALLAAVKGDLSALESAVDVATVAKATPRRLRALAAGRSPGAPGSGQGSGKKHNHQHRHLTGRSSGTPTRNNRTPGQGYGYGGARGAQASDSDSDLSDVSSVEVDDVDAVVGSGEDDDTDDGQAALMPSDPVEAQLFGSAAERLSVVVTRSMASTLDHVGRQLQSRLQTALAVALGLKAPAGGAAKAAGAKPTARLDMTELEALRLSLASEMGNAGSHLTHRLARKMSSSVWNAVLSAATSLILGQAGVRAPTREELPLLGQALQVIMEDFLDPGGSTGGAPSPLALPHDLLASRAKRVQALLQVAVQDSTPTLIDRYNALVAACTRDVPSRGGLVASLSRRFSGNGNHSSGAASGGSFVNSKSSTVGAGKAGAGTGSVPPRPPAAKQQVQNKSYTTASKGAGAADDVDDEVAKFGKRRAPAQAGAAAAGQAGSQQKAGSNSRPQKSKGAQSSSSESSDSGSESDSSSDADTPQKDRARHGSKSVTGSKSAMGGAGSSPAKGYSGSVNGSTHSFAHGASPQPLARTSLGAAGSRWGRESNGGAGGANSSRPRETMDSEDWQGRGSAGGAAGIFSTVANSGNGGSSSSAVNKHLEPLDALRLLLQRAAQGDRAAQQFWHAQAPKIEASSSVMQAVFGQPPSERLLVVAKCSLAGCERPGTVLLSANHLAFTTLLEDGKAAAEAAQSTLSWVKSWWNSGGQADGAPTDTSLLLPLSRIERIDATFYKGAEAVAVSMLSRTTYLLHAFEPGCSTELVTQIRLHVMGWGTPLDRSLRGLEETEGPLQLQLPPGESILRSYTCSKCGTLYDTRGVLYLCTTLLVFDTEEQRHSLPYAEITGLRRERDWRGTHWVTISSPLLARPLWIGDGSEQLAVELLAGIAKQGA